MQSENVHCLCYWDVASVKVASVKVLWDFLALIDLYDAEEVELEELLEHECLMFEHKEGATYVVDTH